MHLLNPLSRFQLKPLPEVFPKKLLISSRNLKFFTNGYCYILQILTAAVVAPMYTQAKLSLVSLITHPNPSPSIPIITAYTTGYGRNSRGMEMLKKSWLPKVGDRIKGALCFCHGYGSTCTFFFEGIARRIAASGYAINTVDYPGFGLSEGLHGYDELVGDVIKQFTNVKGRFEVKGLPFFVMGESMGGAMSLKIHLKEPDKWDGVIVVAPTCKELWLWEKEAGSLLFLGI
ncbi:caffeoylshikimate esterase-like [Malus domestica]|uniref:caffeoylshikimate esterase-like n=1 Tax=Malus domestica TaxID=3750 RepID=UPI0039753510